MSKHWYLERYYYIIHILRKERGGASMNEIMDYLSNNLEEKAPTSSRTIRRDFEEIEKLFGYKVIFKNEKYYLEDDIRDSRNILLEALTIQHQLFKLKDFSNKFKGYVFFDTKPYHNYLHIGKILEALRKKKKLVIKYEPFYETMQFSEREVEPYALKEYQYRWYLIAKDCRKDALRIYALDRIKEIEMLNVSFQYPKSLDIEKLYQHCYGIMLPDKMDKAPEKIQMWVDSYQARYFMTVPLHNTQRIIEQKDEEVLIEIEVYITEDLIMDLMKYGPLIEVIKPNKLKNELIKRHKAAGGCE